MSRIFITGDTHGDTDWHKLTTVDFPTGKELTENDYVIICGDAAMCWDGANFDRYIQKWYNDKPWTTLFIDGNHENHDILDSLPVEIWNGGKVHKISNKIIHLMRGQVFNIDGRTFFTMGGAVSIDKMYRKEGISWWAHEVPTEAEFNEGFENLEKHKNKVDYILSHQAPDFFLDKYNMEHDAISNYLQVINDTVEFKGHFCGHHHVDQDCICKNSHSTLKVLYDRVLEIS